MQKQKKSANGLVRDMTGFLVAMAIFKTSIFRDQEKPPYPCFYTYFFMFRNVVKSIFGRCQLSYRFPAQNGKYQLFNTNQCYQCMIRLYIGVFEFIGYAQGPQIALVPFQMNLKSNVL